MFIIDEVTLPNLGNTGLECPPSEEERAIQESAQRLAKEVLRPIAEKLDKMTIKVELTPEMWADKNLDRKALVKKVTDELISVIVIRPAIELLEPKTIPRSVGKAVRVIDLRKQG